MPVVQIEADLKPLIPRYLEYRDNDVRELREAIEAGQWVHAARLGHRMKGNGQAYGFAEITTMGEEIHTLCQAQEADAALAVVDKLATYLETLTIEYV